MQLRDQYYTTNGIQLHTVEAGKPGDQTILFLHGFPELGFCWEKQLTYFAAQGWHAVAPDQRGYNLSSKPQHVKDYTIDNLTKDIILLIPQISTGKVVLAGHDWGGAVAWNLAMHYPELLNKLIILNMPHPQVLHQHLTRQPKQILRSLYMGFFQIPKLPEWVNSALDYKLLERSILKSALPNTFSPDQIRRYKKAWSKPGALKSMINWYRAYKYRPIGDDEKITTPILLLWGKRDIFLRSKMAKPSLHYCQNSQLHFLEEATHWLHHEKPEQVNDRILTFLS